MEMLNHYNPQGLSPLESLLGSQPGNPPAHVPGNMAKSKSSLTFFGTDLSSQGWMIFFAVLSAIFYGIRVIGIINRKHDRIIRRREKELEEKNKTKEIELAKEEKTKEIELAKEEKTNEENGSKKEGRNDDAEKKDGEEKQTETNETETKEVKEIKEIGTKEAKEKHSDEDCDIVEEDEQLQMEAAALLGEEDDNLEDKKTK